MTIKKSFAIWNNKGGVGKSSITFHIATRYAEKNPSEGVLVIDMCPQSNSSLMILGGGADPQGENKLLSLSENKPISKTIAGYFTKILSGGQEAEIPNPWDFIVQTSKLNTQMPENLFLLCGDTNLELLVPALNKSIDFPMLVSGVDPWIWVHKIVEIFYKNLASQDSRQWMIFMDTNPSFSIYTEIALSSTEKLIVPVNADVPRVLQHKQCSHYCTEHNE
jgi:cellulose biosynthesis protein BcsQ